MFQLIVAVVSIVLIGVLCIAAIWFGGEVFAESKQRSMYAEHVNAAAQIDGALHLYYQENGIFPIKSGGQPAEHQELINLLVAGKYLNSSPKGDWKVTYDQLYKPVDSVEQCETLNKVAGKPIESVSGGCPPCGQELYKSWPGCMVETP